MNAAYRTTAIPASRRAWLVALLFAGLAMPALAADPQVVAWGNNDYGQTTIPSGLTGVTAVAGGYYHTMALKSEGTVVAWGDNQMGQTAIPSGLTGVTAISACRFYNMALKSDGTVVEWGYKYWAPTTIPSSLTGVTAISAGGLFNLALMSNGTVVAWGDNSYGQTTIPSGLTGVTAIAAGGAHALALKSDGTVVAWGWNPYQQVVVPSGLTGVIAIAAGESHSVALKGDGTVVVWGANYSGQRAIPSGLATVRAIAAGQDHTLALKGDGTVVAWGDYREGALNIPSGLTGVTAIEAGKWHSLAIQGVVTYPVAYNANGATSGTAPASQTKTHGVTLTLATNSGNLARTGYAFAGWNTAVDGSGTGYAAEASYNTNASVALYATWTPVWDAELAAEALVAVTLVGADTTANESGDPGLVTVIRNGPTTTALQVDLTYSGTAGNGIDIVRIPASVTIPAGQTTLGIAITPLQDGLAEGNETVTVGIAPGAGYRQLSGTSQSATITLVDDEGVTVNISASDAMMAEPADNGTFTVSRTGPTTSAQTVLLSVAGSAAPGADYAILPASVTIPAGATSVAITVAAIDDTSPEERETVILAVQPNAGYVVGTALATATINDNEPEAVGIEVVSGPAAEPGIGGTFRVYRRGASTASRTVTYTVAGTATRVADYPALSGSVTLAANVSAVNLTITPSNDTLVEEAETVAITLAVPSGAGVVAGSASLTILDNDGTIRPVVSLTVGVATAREPATDGSFIITRTGATTAPLRVLLQPASGTATAGLDYIALPLFVDIPAGSASVTLLIRPLRDLVAESSETVGLSLAASVDYSVSTTRSGTVTITNDPPPAVALAVADSTAAEPGTDTARWSVSRTGSLGQPLTVLLASNGNATAGGDYAPLPASITIPAGATSATVTLAAVQDAEAETDEQVILQILPDPAYGLSGATAGAVTIKDDEAPVISVAAIDPIATEGGDTGKYRVQRRGSLAPALTIPLAWSGAAQNGVDVNTLPATVTLAANAATFDLTVTVKQDTAIEAAEALVGMLQSGAGYTIGQAEATVLIADDEAGGTVSIRLVGASGYEFDASPSYIEVYRTGRLTAPITVPYNVSGTAIVNEITVPREVYLPAGVDAVRLVLTPLRDEIVESDETVILRLLPGTGYVLGTNVEGTVIIIEAPLGSG